MNIKALSWGHPGNNMLDEINSELISRAKNGDAVVIGALYERFRLSIFRYLYYRLGDQQMAEDLTSEVFLRMIRSLPGLSPNSLSFQAWLFQIARNLAIDHYRKMSVRDHVQLDENVISRDEDIDTSLERNLTSERLRRALSRLNPDQRDVIVLRFVADMPITQVAQTLHKSEDSVKGLQRRGLNTLREILAE
jgi:RNA polymerase sigma-70 factor (ECF subfamily)